MLEIDGRLAKRAYYNSDALNITKEIITVSIQLSQSFFDRIKQRAIYLIVAAALEYVAIKFPSLPVFDPQTITDWALALLAAHGVGDVLKLIKEFIQSKIVVSNKKFELKG